MGKILGLKDGTLLEFVDSSTISKLITVVENYSAVDSLRAKLTPNNLSSCEFDGVSYTDVILDEVSTIAKDYGNVQVAFLTKAKEVEELRGQIERLTELNEQLTDKANAADILLGNGEVE